MRAMDEIRIPVTGTIGFLCLNLVAAPFSGQVITSQRRSFP